MTKPQIPVCIAGNFSLNCKNRLKKVTEFAVYRNLQLFLHMFMKRIKQMVHKTAGNYSLPVFPVTQFAVSTVFSLKLILTFFKNLYMRFSQKSENVT